jgi:hypothetical protein
MGAFAAIRQFQSSASGLLSLHAQTRTFEHFLPRGAKKSWQPAARFV